MNDSHRTTAPEVYLAKLRNVAILLVLRVLLFDQWNCLIPLPEIWQADKQIFHLTDKNYDWVPVVRRVVCDNFIAHVPMSKRDDFLAIVDSLLTGSEPKWVKVMDVFTETWSQALANPVEFIAVSEWLVDEENERRRQTELSDQLWHYLTKGFSNWEPSDSIDLSTAQHSVES